MLQNPNKPLRQAYVTLLREATNLPVYAKMLPKDINPPPAQYIIINNQPKNETEPSKNLKGVRPAINKNEWDCFIEVDINAVSLTGYAKPEKNDQVEELVLNAVKNELNVPGFDVKSAVLFQSTDLDIQTQTQFIERKIITFNHWLCQQQDV